MIFLYDNLLIFESYNIVENLRLNSNNFLRQLILPDNLSEIKILFFYAFRYNEIEFDKNKIRQGARIERALQRMRMREIENVNRSVEPLSRSSPIPRRWLIQRNLPTFVRGLNSV